MRSLDTAPSLLPDMGLSGTVVGVPCSACLSVFRGARGQDGKLQDALGAVQEDDTRALLHRPAAEEVPKLGQGPCVPCQPEPGRQRVFQRLENNNVSCMFVSHERW